MSAQNVEAGSERGTPKAVHVTSVHPAFDNRIFWKECQSLRENGYEVVLIAPHERDEEREGVLIRAIRKRQGRIARIVMTTFSAARRAFAENADIYHLHDPELLWLAAVLRLTGRNVIYDMHENVPASILSKDWIPRYVRVIVAKAAMVFERLILPHVAVVFAETSYARHYPWTRTSETILNMPRLEIFERLQKTARRPASIAYIGRIHDDRGASTMLDVLIELKNGGLDVECDFVGSGDADLIRKLLAIAEENELTVRFHGYLPSEEGLSVISGSAIGMAILRPISNYLESYPTKVFEYMSLGMPFVTSNFPLYKEIADTTGAGYCVDPYDVGAIAGVVRELLQDEQVAQRMSDKGRTAAKERFNWSHEEAKLLEFYDDILAA